MTIRNLAVKEEYLVAVEEDLQRAIADLDIPQYAEMHEMISYHMGWIDKPQTRGKRVRPLLTLLSCASTESSWQNALPAASAIELLHNFSLIHDDIEDRSEMRRGRPTLWTKWGIEQAINTGDALFTLAHLSMFRVRKNLDSPALVLDLLREFDQACLSLTQGQYLDIAFETRKDVTSSDYMTMIEGKTAALLAASTAIGAQIGEAATNQVEDYRRFGKHLGLAFQILDDILGIWGEPAQTGKSQKDDIRSRKKTLPILYAMESSKPLSDLWHRSDKDVTADIIDAIERTDARKYAYALAEDHTQLAISALESASPRGAAGDALKNLAHKLLFREQ
jgi:geranylgeranyl diphosphate synthase type I